jgi:ABC-type dipeptide/oligopeptide/nickel transport system permease subunit
MYYAALAGLTGILIAFVISLVLSIKYKWLWLNSLFVLLAGLSSFCIDRFYWNHVKLVFMFPGIPFKSDWAFNFTGGIFMLAIGLSLFFWKGIIRFIDGKTPSPADALVSQV